MWLGALIALSFLASFLSLLVTSCLLLFTLYSLLSLLVNSTEELTSTGSASRSAVNHETKLSDPPQTCVQSHEYNLIAHAHFLVDTNHWIVRLVESIWSSENVRYGEAAMDGFVLATLDDVGDPAEYSQPEEPM